MNGEIYYKPMSSLPHSTLQIQLAPRINQILQPSKLGFAFPELRCSFANVSIVPDIAVLRCKLFLFKKIKGLLIKSLRPLIG
ncbi:MAG: hypothetical protein ACK4QL_11280 [Pseudanabaenaceae cyanobacterium]